MYSFIEDVNKLIDEMIKTNEIKSEAFYRGRIQTFFNDFIGEISNNKPLDAITYFEINSYLDSLTCSDSEKVNIYSAIKRFFDYTYLKGITKEVISQVKRPYYKRKGKKRLSEEDYMKLKKFIVCKENNLSDRLLLGLFLFTGLSRKYIANLKNSDFKFSDGVYKLVVWKNSNEEIELPLKAELQLIINEYINTLLENDMLKRVVNIDSNNISTVIKKLGNELGIKDCSPTILSNTFISKALSNGNYIYEISELTLESVTTIQEHIEDKIDLYNLQTSILNSF